MWSLIQYAPPLSLSLFLSHSFSFSFSLPFEGHLTLSLSLLTITLLANIATIQTSAAHKHPTLSPYLNFFISSHLPYPLTHRGAASSEGGEGEDGGGGESCREGEREGGRGDQNQEKRGRACMSVEHLYGRRED